MTGPELLAWARFLRIANLPSVSSAVFLGIVLSGRWNDPALALALMASSAALFLAGMGMNDLIDLEKDRRTRPERPLPSGQIRPSTAKWACLGLALTGIALAAAGGWKSFLLAVLLLGLILAYNARFRSGATAGILLGLCRALNYFIGLGMIVDDWRKLLPAAAYFFHVQLIMALAAGEDSDRPLKKGDLLFALLPAVCLAAFRFPLAALAALLWLLLSGFIFQQQSAKKNQKSRVNAVGLLVCNTILLDVFFLASAGQIPAALLWLTIYAITIPALKRVPGG